MLGTPLALEILIHSYSMASTEPIPRYQEAPAIRDTVKVLFEAGLVDAWSSHARATPKGEFLLMHLLSVPFPEETYYIPENKP